VPNTLHAVHDNIHADSSTLRQNHARRLMLTLVSDPFELLIATLRMILEAILPLELHRHLGQYLLAPSNLQPALFSVLCVGN
jgi:hypothetical protein